MAVNPEEHCLLRVTTVEETGNPANQVGYMISDFGPSVPVSDVGSTQLVDCELTCKLGHSSDTRSSSRGQNVSNLNLLDQVDVDSGPRNRSFERGDEHVLRASVLESCAQQK